jgi:hypothetical protein
MTVRIVSSVLRRPMAVIAFSSPSSDDVRIWKMGQTRRRKNVENVFIMNRLLFGQFGQSSSSDELNT